MAAITEREVYGFGHRGLVTGNRQTVGYNPVHSLLQPMTGSTRQQAFRRVLSREAGTGADAPAIAAGARRLCERLVQQLTPLIGPAGVAATYARGVHLAQREFPWLAPVQGPDKGDGLFISLQDSLAQQEAAKATEAAVAVLITVVDLLASLIGEGLTTGLLKEAWPADFSRDITQERT